MARVNIDDLWLKDGDDGNPPTATVKRSLANARDPMKAKVPGKWRTPRYGIGKRWRCRWFVINPDGTKQSKTKAFDKLYDAEEFRQPSKTTSGAAATWIPTPTSGSSGM